MKKEDVMRIFFGALVASVICFNAAADTLLIEPGAVSDSTFADDLG